MARRRRSRAPPKWLRERSRELSRQAAERKRKAQEAKADPPKPEPVEVEIVRSTYQPSKVELAEDLRVDAAFEEALDALVKPVKIRRVSRPSR